MTITMVTTMLVEPWTVGLTDVALFFFPRREVCGNQSGCLRKH